MFPLPYNSLTSNKLYFSAVEDEFKVRSLEGIGTLDQDIDVGAIRVSGFLLRKLGSRISLVRVSTIESGRGT